MAKQREHVSCIEDLISLATRAGNRHQVVVADEDAQVGRRREALLDPAVAPTADLAVIEVGLMLKYIKGGLTSEPLPSYGAPPDAGDEAGAGGAGQPVRLV